MEISVGVKELLNDGLEIKYCHVQKVLAHQGYEIEGKSAEVDGGFLVLGKLGHHGVRVVQMTHALSKQLHQTSIVFDSNRYH